MKTKIKNVCTVLAGGTPSTKNKDFWNGTISWITPLDLSKNKGIFISYGERNISKKGLSSCSATLFPKNSVIMSTRAPIGLLAIPTLDKTCTNQGCKTIVCGNSVNNKWLYYYLALLTTKLNFLGNGTTFKEISKENLENLVIDLPPKEQQQHIVDIIGSIDNQIKLLTDSSARLLKMSELVFDYAFNNNEKETKKNIRIGDIITLKKGKLPKKVFDHQIPGSIKYLSINSLEGQKIEYCSPQDMLFSENALVIVGDGASSGKVFYGDTGIVGSTMYLISSNDNQIPNEILFLLLRKYALAFRNKQTGSTIPHLDIEFLKSINFNLPDENTLNRATIVIRELFNLKIKISRKAFLLRNLKNWILPLILNGQIN